MLHLLLMASLPYLNLPATTTYMFHFDDVLLRLSGCDRVAVLYIASSMLSHRGGGTAPAVILVRVAYRFRRARDRL